MSSDGQYGTKSHHRDLLPSMQSQIPAPSQWKTTVNQVSRAGRRPLIHVVVIYAINQRVMNYGQSVCKKFLNSGIDVFFQTSVDHLRQSRDANVNITSSHMANIIVSSHADFLVVIGDRNQKNQTVQSKRKGKLVEMTVSEMQILIWKSWPQNPYKQYVRIQSLTVEQMEELLLQYTGLKHLKENIASLCDTVHRLSLANFQSTAIRVHMQLVKSYGLLTGLGQVHPNLEQSSGGMVKPTYTPNAAYTPDNTIAPLLQFRLSKHLIAMMTKVEEHCNALDGVILDDWTKYYREHKTVWKPVSVEEPPAPLPVADGTPVELPCYYETAAHETAAAATAVVASIPHAFSPDYENSFPPLNVTTSHLPPPPGFEDIEIAPVKPSALLGLGDASREAIFVDLYATANYETSAFRNIASLWSTPSMTSTDANKSRFYSYF